MESNKDDTSYIVGLFADAQKELNSIKPYVELLERDRKKLKNVRVTSLVFTGVGAGLIIGSQFVPDETAKRIMFWTGTGSVASGGFTFTFSFLF